MTVLPDGTLILNGDRLGRIVRSAKQGNAPGYLVTAQELSYGDGYLPHFIGEHDVRLPVIGQTVCPNPWFTTCICRCWCGLAHLPIDQLAHLGGPS